MDRTRRSRPVWPAAVAGVAAAAAGVGAGELVGVFAGTSPVSAVGSALIDGAPSWAKDTAIALFGTGDKIALVVAVVVVVLAVAACAGILERRWKPWGRAALVLLGMLSLAASVTRADAGVFAWLPAVVAAAVAVMVLPPLLRRAPEPAAASAPAAVPGPVRGDLTHDGSAAGSPAARESGGAPASVMSSEPPPVGSRSPEPPAAGSDRRTFLLWTGIATGAGVLAALGGTALRAGRQAASAIRDAVSLPAPTATASVPAGAELHIPGLAPVITPNADFYRIDTAIIVPEIDPADWRLRIHGLVAQEVEITWDELLALPLEESTTTLACVSNEVGGDLIGTAVWRGYPIRELLKRAAPDADADMVLSMSQDGFTAGTPLEALTDERNAILAVGMNGEPLPIEHGFPVRMVVPGLYGYVSATKWVVDLEVTRFADARAYWTDRGWSERGPIKLESRIDVPRRGQSVSAGDTVIAGVAWRQHVGVSGVEVQIDDGAWQQAQLAPAISDDTWVQWMLPWTAAAGEHTIRCRATDAEGETQTPQPAPPAPDGATGWHQISVTVS